jgi:hypothetical protein
VDISRVEGLGGYERDQEYARIVNFIISNIGNSALMMSLNYGAPETGVRL